MLDEGQLLLQIQNAGELFSGYELCTENSKPVLLGRGSYSYVYEVLEQGKLHRTYALRATVYPSDKRPKRQDETFMIWQRLSSQSDHIVRVIERKVLYLELSDDGKLLSVGSEESKEKQIGIELLLMEKLIPVIEFDRFGNARLYDQRLGQLNEILILFEQIGTAVNAAHLINALHRDIKLENIFYDPQRQCYKLGDFGAARTLLFDSASTVIYSDGYGAPEVKERLAENYSRKADMYSLGVSVYLLLNGLKFPAAEGYCYNPRQYKRGFVFPPINGIPARVSRILQKMCAFSPEHRYDSLESVLSDLYAVKQEYQAEEKSSKELPVYLDFETKTYREEESDQDGQNEGQDDGDFDPPLRVKQGIARAWEAFFAVVTICLCLAFGRDEVYMGQLLPCALALAGIGYVTVRRKARPLLLTLAFIVLLAVNIYTYGISILFILLAVTFLLRLYTLCKGISIGYVIWLMMIYMAGR